MHSINAEVQERVLSYQNPLLVKRIAEDRKVSDKVAKTIFEDTKKFLLLAGTLPYGLVPPKKVDDGWHVFILFTEDYADFCEQNFGEMIHHRPTDGMATCERPTRCWGKRSITEESLTIIQTVQMAERQFGHLSENWSV